MNHRGNSQSREANLTLVKGRRLSEQEFNHLSIPEKRDYLQGIGAQRTMKLILADPDAKNLVRSFSPQVLYWMIKEIGETDAGELIRLASAEQLTFFLDMDLWHKRHLSAEKAMEWLGHLVEDGEEVLRELLPEIDRELLILILDREITVGGGIGELASDEERLAPWDHTFDNIYFLSFRHEKHARLVGTFIDLIYRIDPQLYLYLMEGVRNEMSTELEELALLFRAGRLADQGFPDFDDAITIYARLDPSSFVPETTKAPVGTTSTAATVPALLAGAESFLQRVVLQAGDPGLGMEMQYLLNSALVAEGSAPSFDETMSTVMHRIHGCLTIALQWLSDGDEAKAAAILRGEYLKRLFQLGWSILLALKGRAAGMTSDDYATAKVLAGLGAKRPRFYRALDPDGIDGYREFRDLPDVRKVEDFLKTLAGR